MLVPEWSQAATGWFGRSSPAASTALTLVAEQSPSRAIWRCTAGVLHESGTVVLSLVQGTAAAAAEADAAAAPDALGVAEVAGVGAAGVAGVVVGVGVGAALVAPAASSASLSTRPLLVEVAFGLTPGPEVFAPGVADWGTRCPRSWASPSHCPTG